MLLHCCHRFFIYYFCCFSSSLKWSVDLADAMELSLMLFLLMTEFYIKLCCLLHPWLIFLFGGIKSLNTELWVNKKSVWSPCVGGDSSEGWVMSVIAESQIWLMLWIWDVVELVLPFYESYLSYEFHYYVYMSNLFWSLSCIKCYLLQMIGWSCISIWILNSVFSFIFMVILRNNEVNNSICIELVSHLSMPPCKSS